MSKWTFVLDRNSRGVDLMASSANIRDQTFICVFFHEALKGTFTHVILRVRRQRGKKIHEILPQRTTLIDCNFPQQSGA